MKKLILLISIVSLISCENNDTTINDTDTTTNELFIKGNHFPPAHHPMLMALHSDDIQYLYNFYTNNLNQYKKEQFFKVGKVQIIGKLLKEKEFIMNTNKEAYKLFLNDFFVDELPSPSLLVNLIEIIENDKRLSNEIDVKSILNKNKKFLIRMTENLKKIRKSEYKPNPVIDTDLRFLGFEDVVSKYVDLN